jgi:signal transduction histidine kinase
MSASIFRWRKLLPLVAFLFLSAIALLLWRDQDDQDRELVLRHTQTSAEQIKIRIEGVMNARISSLELLADRWVERQPPDFSRSRFVGFAQTLYKHYPGYLGIFWVDPEGVIQWVFPHVPNAVVQGRHVYDYSDERDRCIYEASREGAGVIVMPCATLHQGGIGFHILMPLRYENKLQGFIDGVFRVDQIVELCLGPGIIKNFGISIHEGDRVIYQNGSPNEIGVEKMGSIQVSQELNFGGKTWRLYLDNPTLYEGLSIQNLPFLVFGLALSASLALLIHFLLQRMLMYKESRDLAFREIEERKKVQEALRANEKKLEALLAELSAKNMELESFVYTVSHDLKTPIVTIEGFIGALREDLGSSATEAMERYFKYMSDAARKMEALINDLLNLSRIGRLTEQKTRFPFVEPAMEALETLRTQIAERGIEIDVQEGLPEVYGERKRIGQVLDNLLANATKYLGNDNPVPRIDIGFERRDGHNVFFVRDNGIGIEARYFDKVFQIFERLPAAKRTADGTGIGLTIVKRIIEHHGGKIWLTSEPGKGTIFYFTLQEQDEQNDTSMRTVEHFDSGR